MRLIFVIKSSPHLGSLRGKFMQSGSNIRLMPLPVNFFFDLGPMATLMDFDVLAWKWLGPNNT